MKHLNLFILLFLKAGLLLSQNYELITKIPVEEGFFTTDRFGNFYTIRKMEIKKFNDQGVFYRSYNFNDLGYLNYMDATNPLKLMLFKADFNTIRIIDNRMNVQGELQLTYNPDLGLPKLACVTDDGNYWIYDQQNQRLVKVNQLVETLIIGNSFNQFIEIPLNPKLLIAAENWLVMRNQDSTFFVFDRFGNYYRNMVIAGIKNIQVRGHLIQYFKQGKLFIIDLDTMKETFLETPLMKDATEVRMELHRLYIRKNNQIEVYSF